MYSVSTPIKLKIRNRVSGEEVENDYYVIESRIYNEGNTLKCEYKLGKQTDYFVDPIPHEKIRGAVIEARTVHIARTDESKSEHGRADGSSDNLEGRTMGLKPVNIYVAEEQEKNNNRSQEVKASDIAVMTVDLTEGLRKLGGAVQSEADKYAGKSYFPYVTPYSQTNTGFTPAPEPNDRIALYFPSENETHALVMGAVNNDGNGRFTNPDKRNFTLGNSQSGVNTGKPMYDFTLNSEVFSISVGSLISMTSNGTVGITGSQNVDIASTGSSVGINASENIDMGASQSINAEAAENIKATAATDIGIIANGGKAEMKASTYATVKAGQNAEISGGSNTNIGFSSGGFSSKTAVQGARVEVKGGIVEIN